MPNKEQIQPEILAVSERGGKYENIHYGWICATNQNSRVIFKRGNLNNLAFLRSVAKPIQAIPLINSGTKISLKELATICASHSGSQIHLRVLQELMRKHSIGFKDLQCGIHMPGDEDERKRLIKNNLSPNILHNNCSGKHIGMLMTCIKNKWDKNLYLNNEHPLQKEIKKNIKDLSKASKISTAIDGCSAPTFGMPIKNVALMFSSFTCNQSYEKIIQAMTQYPYYVGGNNQLDSEIMKVSNGEILSKVGGGGIIIAAKNGESIFVKMADGNQQARGAVIIRLLLNWRWLTSKMIKNTILEEIAIGNIKNHSNKVVGKFKIQFNL